MGFWGPGGRGLAETTPLTHPGLSPLLTLPLAPSGLVLGCSLSPRLQERSFSAEGHGASKGPISLPLRALRGWASRLLLPPCLALPHWAQAWPLGLTHVPSPLGSQSHGWLSELGWGSCCWHCLLLTPSFQPYPLVSHTLLPSQEDPGCSGAHSV